MTSTETLVKHVLCVEYLATSVRTHLDFVTCDLSQNFLLMQMRVCVSGLDASAGKAAFMSHIGLARPCGRCHPVIPSIDRTLPPFNW